MTYKIKRLPLFFLFVCSTLWSFSNELAVENATADLLQHNFSENKFVELNGEWMFYWDQLIDPSDISTVNGEVQHVPGMWKNFGDGETYNAQGFATFYCKVEVGEDAPLLGLKLSNIHNSYKLFVNGKLVKQLGEVGTNEESTVPKWKPVIVPIQEKSKSYEIVIQVANFHHRNGGMQDPILFGEAEALFAQFEDNHYADLFLAGSLLVIGLFFMGMFLFWKEDRASLFFGLFAFAFAIRVLTFGSRPLISLFPDIPWQISTKLEYLSMFCSGMLMVYFVYYIFPGRMKRWYFLGITRYYWLVIAVTIFTPATIYSWTVYPNNIVMLTIPFATFPIFIKALINKEVGARWAVFSIVLSFVNFAMMIFAYLEIVMPNPVIISLSFIAFVLSMSFIFASRFGRAFYDVKSLKDAAVEKRELIAEQSEEIQTQHDQIFTQKEELEFQHTQITDSIDYAERIQRSLLPKISDMNDWLSECFVFFKPQNVVSGDFYFCRKEEQSGEVILAIADCTGHGVPGAFMSMIGINSLDKILIDAPQAGPSEILNRLNEEIHRKISVENEGDVRDGMDIAVCRIDAKTNKVVFASAHHKLLLVKAGGASVTYKGDSFFIGEDVQGKFDFKEHTLELDQGDEIFMFSDGTFDQKGGTRGKRLYYQRLEEWLTELHQVPVAEQAESISNKFKEWMKNQEQIDDMLLFGWKV